MKTLHGINLRCEQESRESNETGRYTNIYHSDAVSLSGFTDEYRFIFTNGIYHPSEYHVNTISTQYQ